MKLLVVSHKVCWPCDSAPAGFATDGGFPFQMAALSELFDETRLCVPCLPQTHETGQIPLFGHRVTVIPLKLLGGEGFRRKVRFPFWLLRNLWPLLKQTVTTDAIHTPIPGDVGTIGMLLAWIMRKPLFVRHCGNWLVQTTVAEHFWKWFIEKFAGGRNVMLATGGSSVRPSITNPNVCWIFSTSLRESELSHAGRERQADSAPVRLIIVCRQDEEKGSRVVIESLPLILSHFPHATLDVVGDGKQLNNLRALATELGLDSHITFHGKVDHETVVTLLKAADIFCYPTTASEGFPKVVLEALATGLPVVATPVSVLGELIGGNGCGLLIDKASATQLADAVERIVSDRKQYGAMSWQAVRTAQQYSLERWRDTIGERLRNAWGRPLRSECD